VYVNRLSLLNVKPLHRTIPAGGGAFPEPAQKRLLLQGANGSGKSTILETILTLWKFWGEWIEEGHGSPPPSEHLQHYLAKADLAAVEFAGLPNSPPLWIGMGKRSEWRALHEAYPSARFAGLIRETQQLELPSEQWLDLRRRSLAGSEPFPNIVYFPPEGRTLRSQWPGPPRRGEIIDTTPFTWVAVYEQDVNLDSVLLTVKAMYASRFDDCLRLINLALEHQQKRITGFGPKGRLVVDGRTEAGVSYQHSIEELSSGEQEMLLLVGFVVAFLRPGGIVLIDEPDLHIHISMVTQLLQTLEFVVSERKGQLLVASHLERVWDYFSREDERVELSPWRGGKT
jgi:energy-coupling factor transporter ATP-binding protein EcfA2